MQEQENNIETVVQGLVTDFTTVYHTNNWQYPLINYLAKGSGTFVTWLVYQLS